MENSRDWVQIASTLGPLVLIGALWMVMIRAMRGKKGSLQWQDVLDRQARATETQNELLKETNQLLRKIADKQ